MTASLAASTPEEVSTVEAYLSFTASPSRNRTQRKKDLATLLNLEYVDGVTFFTPEILVVGTKTIYLYSSRKLKYEIGSFLIFLIRKRIGKRWYTDFYFKNINHVREKSFVDRATNEPYTNRYHHPHIIETFDKPDQLKNLPVGKLCISHGQHGVYQMIREAKIHVASQMLINILHTRQIGAYAEVDTWPRVED